MQIEDLNAAMAMLLKIEVLTNELSCSRLSIALLFFNNSFAC
jgi:hypothetical protein